MSCVTINSPIQNLLKPNQVQVRFFKNVFIYYNFGKTKSLFLSSKYRLDFNLTTNEVLEIYVEVHPKEQSVMNQNWGMDNLLFFNNRGGNWELYTYKVNVKML